MIQLLEKVLFQTSGRELELTFVPDYYILTFCAKRWSIFREEHWTEAAFKSSISSSWNLSGQ